MLNNRVVIVLHQGLDKMLLRPHGIGLEKVREILCEVIMCNGGLYRMVPARGGLGP